MTMQPQPYNQRSAGFFWGTLTQAQKEDVLKNVASRAAHLFGVKVEAYKRATGLRKPKGAQLLAVFRGRPPERWQMLRMGLPRVYEAQIKEWGRLEEAAAEKGASG